jgi:hypothetical protein
LTYKSSAKAFVFVALAMLATDLKLSAAMAGDAPAAAADFDIVDARPAMQKANADLVAVMQRM